MQKQKSGPPRGASSSSRRNNDDANEEVGTPVDVSSPAPAEASTAVATAERKKFKPADAMRIGGARRGRGGKAVVNSRAMVKQRQQESIEAMKKMKESMEAQRPRYNRGDVFESDTVMNMQLKDTESDDAVFAKKQDKRVEKPLTSKELAALEDPQIVEEREKAMQERLQQLEEALPETVRAVDNLSAAHRRGERTSNDRFRGSLVDYVFKLQAEVEKAGAKEMKQRSESEWVAWLEHMYRRHQPFSDDHYQWFRKVCEGRLNEDPLGFKLLLLSKLQEKKRLTSGECDKLGSEYTTIKTMYPQMRASVEEHRKAMNAKKQQGEHTDTSETTIAESVVSNVVGDAEFVDDEGTWRWWSERKDDGKNQIPNSFIQWCLSTRFTAETSDYETLKKESTYELLCCFKNATTGKKTIRFFRAGAEKDDFAMRHLSDATIQSWIESEAVTEPELLNHEAHFFLLDRTAGGIDKWAVICYNKRIDDSAIGKTWQMATTTVETASSANEKPESEKTTQDSTDPADITVFD